MKTFPLPVLLAAASSLVALPYNLEAAVLLAFTAGLGAIICVDYPHRYRGLPVPRRAAKPASLPHQAAVLLESNRLAA